MPLNPAYARNPEDHGPDWGARSKDGVAEHVGICARRGVTLRDGEEGLSQAGDRIEVCIVRDPEQRAMAWDLVARRYAWRGYRCTQEAEPFPDAQRQPFYTTLLALRGGRPVGTVTLGVDSPGGLLVDQVNKPDVDRVRSSRRRASEIVRLAIEERAESREVWTALLQTLNLLCRRIHDVSDLFVEVNPRHVPFYRRVFSFQEYGPVRVCPRVGAPSVLLRLRREELDAMLTGQKVVPSARPTFDAAGKRGARREPSIALAA